MTQQNKCAKRAGMHRGDRGLGGLIFPLKMYNNLKLETRIHSELEATRVG